MAYQLPNYILVRKFNTPEVTYRWYDPDPDTELDFSVANRYVKKLKHVGLRMKIGLCISIHEWILCRFLNLTNKIVPYQLAEAAWCANINVNYLRFFEFGGFGDNEYIGPIDSALLSSSVCLREILYVSNNVYDLEDVDVKDPVMYSYNVDEWKETLKVLIALALHVLPETDFFVAWLEGVTKRLINQYTLPEQSPFDNLFGDNDEEVLLGECVPRELFELEKEFDKSQTTTLLNQFLASVSKTNPLLYSAEELKGKIATPYRII